MATTNLGKVSVTPKGEYDPLVTYERLDVISHNGSSYIVKQSSTGVTPIEGEFYALIAEKGDGGSFVKKAYKTYAAMDADKVNIPTNSSVDVTNDLDESKNGAYIYDGVVFTRSQYDSKVVTDKIISDAAIAVQDAINNTAVEGGVLADTFVTVTAFGDGAVARNLRDVNRDVINVKDFGAKGDWDAISEVGSDDTLAFAKTISHISTYGNSRQGGRKLLKVPAGSYYVDNLDFVGSETSWGFDIVGESSLSTIIYFNPDNTNPAITSNIEALRFKDIGLIGISMKTPEVPPKRDLLLAANANNYLDVDCDLSGVYIRGFINAVKIQGRGCVINSSIVSNITESIINIELIDGVRYGESYFFGDEYGGYRHFTLRNCRTERITSVLSVTGSNASSMYINDVLISGNDFITTEMILNTPNHGIQNFSYVSNNFQGGGYTEPLFHVGTLSNSVISGNAFMRSPRYFRSPPSSIWAYKYFVFAQGVLSNVLIGNNVISSIWHSLVASNAVEESSAVSIVNNSLHEFSPLDDSTGVMVYNSPANCKGLLISGNNFQSSEPTRTKRYLKSGSVQKLKDMSITANISNDVLIKKRSESFEPTVKMGDTVYDGADFTNRTSVYWVEGDYIEGVIFLNVAKKESQANGSVNITLTNLPTPLVRASSVSSVVAGTAKVVVSSGLTTGLSWGTSTVSTSGVIVLNKQVDINTQQYLMSNDITSPLVLQVEFKYKFR